MANKQPKIKSPEMKESNDINDGWLISSIQEYFSSSKFSDVTITTAGQELKLHKLVICGQSKYFSRLFNHTWKETTENIIRLEDDDPEAVLAMIHFMYGFDYEPISRERCQISPMRFHVGVYQVADKYDVPRLKEHARRKFAAALKTCWKMDEFPVAILDAYSTTPSTDRGLRDLIVSICLEYLDKLLRKNNFKAILEEAPGFAADLIQHRRYAESTSYSCPSCTGVWRIQLPNPRRTFEYCPLCGTHNKSWWRYVKQDLKVSASTQSKALRSQVDLGQL